MKAYYVKYTLTNHYPKVKGFQVLANSKEEAYNKGLYEILPKVEPLSPEDFWVDSVTYNNGNYVKF